MSGRLRHDSWRETLESKTRARADKDAVSSGLG